MRVLWAISDFGRAMRRELRFGELSRAPLQLLRFEWRGAAAECEWLARAADPWDSELPQRVRNGNVAEQALRDAIAIRELLFDALPKIESATLRAFRQSPDGAAPGLIIAGAVNRGEQVPRNVSSTAMRAKLLGFQFWSQDGALETLPSEACEMSF
jgi:hypothetical protein